MAERPLYTLYKNLKAQNYDVPNDYNKFESALTRDGKSGADNRHAIYENLKAQNFDVPDTYERFYTALFEPRSKTSSRAKGGSVPMSAADRARFSAGAAAISASAKQMANNAGRYNRLKQRKQKQQKDFGRVNLGTHLTPFGGDANDVVKDDFAYNPETGKAGAYVTSDNENAYTQSDAEQRQAILDKYGEEWNKAVDMGMVPSELDKADPGLSDTDVAMRQMERRQEWLDENQNRRSNELDESMHLQDSPFVASGGAVAPSSFNTAIGNEANRLSDAEYGAYNTAKAYNQMLRTTLLQELKEQKQRNEDAGWWKDKWNDVSNYFGGMFNTMLAPKLYSQGVMDAAIASNLLQVKKGMEDGTIKKGSNAGNAAQVMLGAIQQQQGESAKQQQYGTKAYQYGDVSGRSLKFMADFALSGWRNVMTTGFTKAGEKVGEKMALGALGKWFTKNTGRVLGDMAGSAALAATNQLGSTYNNVIERYVGMNNENGGVTQDKDGELKFNKGVSLGKAIKDGFGSATIENFSEMFGEYLPGASKLLSKLGLSKVSSFFEKIGNNAYYKWLSNATNKSGIQGVMAEISEEEFGTALHAAWGDGDGSWSDFNVFTNPDAREKQIDTCLGMFYSVGFMQSPRTAVGAINAVRYFNIKHQVTKADKFGQAIFGDNWEEIKSKIDVTTNADLTKTVLDATRSDSMTAKQKGAVINYAMFLSKLRGFNQASDAKTKDKVEEGETAPTLSNDLDDAYTEGHNADDADKHDIQVQHEDQMKTLAAALNISEQQLSGMSDEELESLTGQDDKLDQAIYDYQMSSARYQGVVDDAQDKVDLAAHQAEQRVNMYTDQSRGSVRNATIKASGGAEDYGVYIISGNIATHDDGSIDVSNSDDMILYFDPTTNSVEHADALMFAELGEELPADDVKAQAVADAKENAIKEVAGIIDGTVEVGSQFNVTDADGTEHTYEVLADNGDGTAMITIDGNVPTELVKGENVQIPYSFADLQQMKDLEDQKRLEAAKAEREQMEKERDEQQTEETQPSFDFNQILNDDGNVVLVDVLGQDGNTKYPGSTLFLIRDAGAKAKVVELKSDGTIVPHAVNKEDVATISSMSLDEYKQAMPSSMIEDNSGENRGEIEVETPTIEGEAAGPAEETTTSESGEDSATEQTPTAEQTPAITLEDGTVVPMLEDGNPDFSKLSAAQTAELYDSQFGEDADGIVSGYVSDAKKALDKANNMTVKGKTFVEQKAAKDAKEKAIADAQAAYDSAVAIRDAYNERQLAKEENTPEGRKSLIEKARRKYARLKNSEEWSERPGDLWNETVGKLLHRLYDATGIDVFNDTPNTVYEYVASNVGPYSLNYEGNDNSKGVQQETGLSRSDFAKLGWLAAEGKGMTIDAKVHRLWENRPSNLESADTQEIRNALISLITSGQTAFQARDYILNQRIELAESALEEQLRQEEDAAEAQKAKEEEEKKKAELEKKKAEEEKTNENRNAPELSHEQQKAKEEGEKLGFPAVDKEGEPINQNVIELANWAKEQGLEIDSTSKSNSYADLFLMCKDGFGVSTLVPDEGENINQVVYFPDNVQGEQLLKLQEEFNVGRDIKHSADMNSELTEGAMFYDGDTAREFKEFVDKKVEKQNKVFGEQRPEEDLPFSAKDNGQQQTTAERAADVEKNKVDDMKVVDNIVGQKTRKAFDRLAKMMGANIQWQYSDKLGNGWIQETTDADGNVHRTIFITLDSSITEGAQFIFGHEMTHQIKNLNSAAYNELTQLVLDTYGSDAFDKAIDETTKRYSDAGFSGRDRDYYAEEVVADAVGEMIRDLNLAHTLAMKMSHPLLAAIHEILQKIKLSFYGTEYSDVTKNIIRSIEQAYVKTAKIDNSSETAKENGEKFSLKDEKTLAGVHNITEEKLLKAIKQGGLANPSVAVIDSSKQNHEDYGDISLILPSEKVAKRTGKNAGTWQGDAWTPTYPQVERQMSNKGAGKASKDVSSVPGDMYREVRRGIDRWLDGGEANSAMAYMFLHEKGVAPEPKKIQHKFSDDVYNELKSITAGDFNIYGIGKADAQKVLDMYIDAKFDGDKDLYEEKTNAWLERNKSIVDAGNKGGMRYTIAKDNVELYDKYGFNYKSVQTFVRDVEYDHRKTGVDTNATLNDVEDYIKTNNLTDEFNTWLEGKEKEYGIKEVIFDGFTPSGNRRYVPNTLENVSKIMKKQGRNGATGISVSFQNFAASLMPSYGTLNDIRSKKGLLTSDHEDLDKFNEKWSNVFFELGMKCQPDATGTFDDYGLARLSEAAKTSDPQAYLKKEYNVDFSDEDTKRLKEMVKAIKEESPAMYFETKFERPVGFNEFSSAVVPTTASDEVKQALQNAGVQIYEYDKEKEEDRSRAFNEAINGSDNIRFSLKSMMEKPEGWKQANKKAIHIAEAIERDPKFSLKNLDGTLIKAGTYFSGGGLVEEGLKGIIDPVLAVEYDEKISGVYRNNFGQHIVTADVRDVDPKELVKQIDGEVEYFHASPVCKNYSQAKSNHAEVELDKETAASTAEFINAIKPKVVTIENVKGYKDSDAMKTITDALDSNGYTWDADVYNAADYGGYTNRERLIVRAVREGKLPAKPKKMAHKSGWYEAVADIIPTLTEKKNGVAPWMDVRLKADGIDWRNIDKPLYVMGSAYADGKIPHAFADELLPTLRTKSGDVIVMPDGKVYRAMGRVLARVSGVSDDYKMPFSENLSHTIIGNGIPTQLTEHVIAPLLTGSDPKFSIRTYHGTGASFGKFDLSHALEGEGSETFGHGVYVTNSKEIGTDYAQRAKDKKAIFGFEFVNPQSMSKEAQDMLRHYMYKHQDVAKGLENARKDLKDVIGKFPDTDYLQELNEILAKDDDSIAIPSNRAYRYDVDIPDDNGSNYLGWNESQNFPLEKWYRLWEITHEGFNENEYFKDGGARYDIDRIERITQMKLESPENGMQKLPTLKGEELYHALEDFFNRERPSYGAELASRALSEIGFVGIKYPAGLIHGGAKEGDYNYVIFDENNANIVGNTRFSLRYDQFEHDLNQWKKDNNLPKDAKRPTIPQRNVGESAVDFLKRVDEYRKQMALWKTAPTYEQHLLSDDTALGEFNRELQRGSVLKRIAFQDSMLAIRKAQEAIMKEVGVDRLNMAEDAYTAENRSHGKGKNEFEEYNNEFLQPLRKAYHQMKKVLGDSYDNVRLYMMAKHGLERNAQMAFKKSLEADYEDVAQRSAAYKAYKGDINRMGNDSGFELGLIDYATWVREDNAIKMKYSPSYMKYRYDKMGIAFDYSGLSALFDGSDFEEAAYKLVRDIESKHIVETKELWDATNAATKKILRDGYKAGMMSKDTYQYVRDMYSHYIPLRGWDGTTADQVWDYIGGGKGAFNQTLKKAHGRTSIADDPIAYIENMAESGILLNNKNWVKQHLMLLAQNHPTSLLTLSKAWYVKSTDANGNEEWIPATPQITSQMNSNQVKAAIDAFEQKMENMAQTGDATQKRDGLNIAYPQTHSEEREHEVRVMKDGEEYVIYVNGDPQLAQAMNNTRAHRVREIQSGKLDRAAAWLGRKMAAAYTSLSPLFIPSNYFRDLTMTLASTAIREDAKYNYLLRKNLATSWNLGFMLRDYQNGKLRDKVNNGNATPKQQMFYDFMMNGGETGFVSSLDVDDLKKKFKNDLKDLDRWKANPVKVGHTIMDSIEFLNRAIEDSNRFAIYMTSIQYGRSIDEAVNDAKGVTLNFNRKGTGEYGWQMIRNLYLFINPAVQSLQTLGALAKHHPFKFTAVTASWLTSGVLVPIVNAALMSLLGGDDDKDKYWQFSKWDRRNNLIMWIPFTHEYVKIPLAQEFRAFYGVGDMIASKMVGGELAEESWSQYAEDLLGQVVDMLPLDPTGYDGNIAVSLMPNAIRPIFELAFNVDFTGKPLFKETEYNKYDPNFTKAYVGTPDWLVRVSKMVNSIGNDYPDVQQNSIDAFGDPRYNLNNPGVVDHVLSSYLGGAYTMGSQVLGLLTKSLNDPKEIKMADIPLFSKFVSNPDDRPASKKQGDEFWNMKENHDRAANTLSKLKKQAKVDGDYSMLERFYGSEEYKQYKQDDVKVKKYEEDKKKERAEESGEEYRPHKLNVEDIYKAHATPKDDFEDLKLTQLYTKLNGFKSTYDLLVDTAPSQSDGYYNTNKSAIDAIDEITLDKQEISELKKGFLDDGKDAYNAEDMKRIRKLRKKILAVLEKANKVVVANQKAKVKKK